MHKINIEILTYIQCLSENLCVISELVLEKFEAARFMSYMCTKAIFLVPDWGI
jgi:hypothetical protein